MSRQLPDDLLERFSGLVESVLGLDFPPRKWRDLSRAMNKAAQDHGSDDGESFTRRIMAGPAVEKRIEGLAHYLTIGESYFLRDERLFAALEHRIIPDIAGDGSIPGKRIRIWSAGCATGEEPYSLAIALHRTLPESKLAEVDILATDVNTLFLEKAVRGVYSEWSFRKAPPWLKGSYFKQAGDRQYEVIPEIKGMVSFKRHNLAGGMYPSPYEGIELFDMIFCRNVLMYFTPDRIKQAAARLAECLVAGGWLIVSPTEADRDIAELLEAVYFPGAIVYRKFHTPRPTVRDLKTSSELPLSILAGLTSTNVISLAGDTPTPVFDRMDGRGVGDAPTVTEESVSDEPADAAFTDNFLNRDAIRLRDDLAGETRVVDAVPRPAEASPAGTAREYADRGMLHEALALCDKALESDRLNPDHHYLRGTILLETGKIEEAAKAMKRALFLSPESIMPRYALGNVLRLQGKIGESDKHFNAALALLDRCSRDEIISESEGMTAGRLIAIIRSAKKRTGAAYER